MQSTKQETLVRKIGVRGLALNGVNMTVGAGIFALPAVVAMNLGAAAILAYLLCGFLLSLVLLCFIEVGTRFTSTGGIYSYVEHAFGPYAGFLTNMLYVAFAIAADAAVANVLAENLGVLLPVFQEPIVKGLLMASVFGVITLVNVLGLKHGIILVELVTLAKVIPLFFLIVAGVFFISPENLRWTDSFSITTFGEASLILFFAFGGGIEGTFNTTGEIINPRKTIPRGILLSTGIVLLIYISIQVVSQGVLGDALKLESTAPLAAVASKIIGSSGSALMIMGATISCFGLLSSDILTSSRLPYAAARDGLLPSFIGKVHPKYLTPYWAVIVHASLGLILALTGGFRQLAILSSSAILLVYVGVILATIKLRKIKSENALTLPGGFTIHILALAATAWFLSYLTMPEIIATAIFLGICSGFYFVNAKRK